MQTTLERSLRQVRAWAGVCALGLLLGGTASAQVTKGSGNDPNLAPDLKAKVNALVESRYDAEVSLHVGAGSGVLVRLRQPVHRVSVVNPEIVQVVQYGPTELQLFGLQNGQTTLYLWFGEAAAQAARLGYRVQVGPQETYRGPRLAPVSKYRGPPPAAKRPSAQ